MSKPYIPRAGSLSSKLIQHLRENPADALTSVDVARLLQVGETNVQTAMARAVQFGILARDRSVPLRQYHYTAGQNIHTIQLDAKPAPVAAAPVKPIAAALCQYGSYCPTGDTLTLNAAQRERLCLVIGAYVMAAAAMLEATA